MNQLPDVVYVLKALSDETRLKIIKMLVSEELCACHILEEFEITQPTLSYHMKILVDAKIVSSRKDGNWIRYSLNKTMMLELESFFHELGIDTGYTQREATC
ncbi:MAG: metalloregulator ArsR/SmtB family transcription factor [Erysipelothrix sp.]